MSSSFTKVELPDGTIYGGSCFRVLPSLPGGSVHLCVTSPPYWGLRDYQTGSWEGGDVGCDHRDERQITRNINHSVSRSRQGRTSDVSKLRDGISGVLGICPKCGARRVDDQIGLEECYDCSGWATGCPCGECYVCHLVAVFREVRRVLHPSGLLVLNLGDSYNAAGRKTHGTRVGEKQGTNRTSAEGVDHVRPSAAGVRSKNLLGIPWRVALALQADGWILRSDIPWVRRGLMPESVTDRPSKALEYVFLLAKKERYYWDAMAVRREALQPEGLAMEGTGLGSQHKQS